MYDAADDDSGVWDDSMMLMGTCPGARESEPWEEDTTTTRSSMQKDSGTTAAWQGYLS